MRAEDVPGEWVEAAAIAIGSGTPLSYISPCDINGDEMIAAIIAAVAPLIAKAERERCAGVADKKAAGLIQAGKEMRQYFEMANGRNPAPPMDQLTYQFRTTVAEDIATDIRALGDGEVGG